MREVASPVTPGARAGHGFQVVEHQQQRAARFAVAADALEHALHQRLPVAQRAALVATAEPQHAVAKARGVLGGRGLCEPRLADAAGADHRQPATLGQREPLAQLRKLDVATDQRAAVGLADEGRGRPRDRRIGRDRVRDHPIGRDRASGRRIGMDARVKRIAVGRRPRAQALGQRGAAGFILRDCRDAAATRGQQAHQLHVRRLVGVVDLEHAVRMLDGLVGPAFGHAALHQVAPQRDRRAGGALARVDQPALEIVTGGDVESVEQRAAPGTRRRGALGGRPLALVQRLLQRLQIHRHRRPGGEADLLRVDVQQAGQPAAQARQRHAQVGARRRLVEIAPQDARKPRARHRPAFGREMEHQRLVLGGHQARERLPVELQAGRSEQQHPQTLHLGPPDVGNGPLTRHQRPRNAASTPAADSDRRPGRP